MPSHSLDASIKSRLIDELGDRGALAGQWFDTAHALLDASLPGAPLAGQAIAHCLRQAFQTIADAGGTDGSSQWRDISRSVVDAAEQYRRMEGVSPDTEQALRTLLTRIDEMQHYHDDEPKRFQRQLRNVMDYIGVGPVGPIAADPVNAAQDLRSKLNKVSHSGTADADTEQLWEASLAVLGKLFLPPQERIPKLKRLAATAKPTAADRADVIRLVASREHLRRFLALRVSVG